MIHAYLFVLDIREGNGGHGPNFLRVMNGINRQAGTNISVYHSFHDEVRVYKKHWWRCDGPCRDRKPFYGYVKRCMNRAPGPHDFWFAQHQRDCGGKFIKIKEPTPKKKAPPTKPKKTTPTQNISNYFNKGGRGNTAINRGGGTLVITKPPIAKPKPPAPSSSNIRTINSPPSSQSTPKKGSNLPSNIVGFKDFGTNTGTIPKIPSQPTFSGGGHTLGGSSNKRSRLLDQFEASTSKKQKTDNDKNDSMTLLNDGEDDLFRAIDLDHIEHENNTTLSQADKAKARQTIIKQEILTDSNGFGDDDESDIILIDDEYDNDYNENDLNLSKEVIVDLFTDDMMGNKSNSDDDTLPCPICNKRFKKNLQKDHVDKCYEEILRANSPTSRAKNSSVVMKEEVIVIPDDGPSRQEMVQCPVCPQYVMPDKINEHLDKCLANSFDDDF